MEEMSKLIDELVSKRGPNTGCIKVNQDPAKVARLIELGYNEPVKEAAEVFALPGTVAMVKEDDISIRLKKIETTLADYEKRIKVCEIRR